MRSFTFIIILILGITGTALSLVTYFRRDNKYSNVDLFAPKSPLQKTIFKYQEYIDETLCQSGTPGAALAIVKDDSVVFLKGFGVRDENTEELVDTHTVFRLASVSKCFTSMLAGNLVEDSLLSWDDPVLQYWPDFSLKPADQTDKMKVKNLLSHTTGFLYHAYTNLIEEGESFSGLMEKLTHLNLTSPIGKQYSYQNVAFSIMDKVVDGATGESFRQNMKDRLFTPLGMHDASMSYEALSQNSNVAFPHSRIHKTWKRIAISPSYYNVVPAGGINASISDMGKWLKAMLGNAPNVIAPRIIHQLFQPVVKADPKNKNFNLWQKIERSYYGLGWRILCFKNDTIAYHGGYVNGYRSEVIIYPKEKIGICVLANGAGNFVNRAIPAFLTLYSKYNHKTVSSLWLEHKPLDPNTLSYRTSPPSR